LVNLPLVHLPKLPPVTQHVGLLFPVCAHGDWAGREHDSFALDRPDIHSGKLLCERVGGGIAGQKSSPLYVHALLLAIEEERGKE
jgi:hypothetical protein